MKIRVCLIFIFYVTGMSFSFGQNLILGAEKDNFYIELLKDKKIGVVVNQTSQVRGKHLVDFLISVRPIMGVFSKRPSKNQPVRKNCLSSEHE